MFDESKESTSRNILQQESHNQMKFTLGNFKILGGALQESGVKGYRKIVGESMRSSGMGEKLAKIREMGSDKK